MKFRQHLSICKRDKTSDRWENELGKIKASILNEDKLNDYATDIWHSLKNINV